MQIDQRIGANINLRLRLQRDEAREELEKAKYKEIQQLKKMINQQM